MTIYPVLVYDDAHAAMSFLEKAFGFERLDVFEDDAGKVQHAELRLGDDLLSLSSTGSGNPIYQQGVGRTAVYVAVDDVDGLHDRAKSAGAEVLMPPTDQDYGSRDFSVRDPEGNVWAFGTYRLGSGAG